MTCAAGQSAQRVVVSKDDEYFENLNVNYLRTSLYALLARSRSINLLILF